MGQPAPMLGRNVTPPKQAHKASVSGTIFSVAVAISVQSLDCAPLRIGHGGPLASRVCARNSREPNLFLSTRLRYTVHTGGVRATVIASFPTHFEML